MDAASAGGFDLSALSSVLNDPAIRGMAEQIAADPAFAQMTQALQSSLVGGGDAAAPGVDPAKYAEAMGSVLQNPDFMQMAERLGQQIMQQDSGMAALMQSMQNPESQAAMEARLLALKEDPELAPIMAEVEAGGPAAMMKYWDNPVVLEKLSKAMGSAFEGPVGDIGGVVPGPDGGADEGDGEAAGDEDGADGEEEGEGEATVHSAASCGDVELLKSLLDGGATVDEADDEGRTALHFSSGYGEVDVVKVLLAAGAAVDSADNNDNTALHYAAGYGQPECVALLLESGASKAAKNKDGKTAAEVAQLNGQDEVVGLLGGAPATGESAASEQEAASKVETADA